MELAIFLVTILAIVRASDATWCVCKSGLNDTALQKAIDYACGHGADCTPIKENGGCYNPNTVIAHCSYAANSYYQKNNEESTACDFGGAAATTSTDPSTNGCTYPASTSAAAGSSGSTTNDTSIQPSGSAYGLGPSSVPYNSNAGFRPETWSALWTLSFGFILIASLHCKA
ncbi:PLASMODESMATA CALLOSE-BINDING PROTEIN 2-like [Carex rostrata]